MRSEIQAIVTMLNYKSAESAKNSLDIINKLFCDKKLSKAEQKCWMRELQKVMKNEAKSRRIMGRFSTP